MPSVQRLPLKTPAKGLDSKPITADRRPEWPRDTTHPPPPVTLGRPNFTVRAVDGKATLWHLLCATVPDGPGCRWADGKYARVEAENAAALKAAETARAVPTAETRAPALPRPCSKYPTPDDGDGSIPDFLQRV